ncbi:coiled-coil domain containing 92B [Sphaerodactylus townsendi]|uniref:coiled-coil domain containing 92B n=1 Tax=Sphaerodactylus townsendi TaxID=933632 RepID=UPI0020273487|nr:coiled-coil domain containing 92B [Sphaerodactylus townsendi]
METLSLEHQIQSVQRHIAFLKKEQMGLLHDLHLEILRLQKHCTELTHDLETKELEISHQEIVDQELEEKCKVVDAQLQEQEEDNLELRKELRHKESLVAALRSSLRNKERKFLEELKRRSHRVTILNTELQKQTEAAAYLSFQLHATKQKLRGTRPSAKPLSDRPPERTFLPPPASEARPKKRTQKSHSRRQAAGSSHGKGAFKDPSFHDQLSSFEDAEPMPDPALFLYTKRHHAPDHHQKPEPKATSSPKVGAAQSELVAPKGLPTSPARNQRKGHQRSSRQPSQEPAGPRGRTFGKSRSSSKGDPSCKENGASPHREKDTE